jgi:hypothetical protein
MSRAIYFCLSAIFVLAGATLALVGDRIGLPAMDLPFWSLMGAAIVVVSLARLISSFSTSGRSCIARETRPAAASTVLLMKAPRFASDRRSGQSSRVLVGT